MATSARACLALVMLLNCAAVAQGLWQQLPVTGPSARAQHAMVYDAARGRIVLFGGTDGPNRFGDTWTWNGTAWSQLAVPGPTARYAHAMAYDSIRSRVVLFGGDTASGPAGDTWEWDGSVWSPALFATNPPARSAHAMAYDAARGETILFGGISGTALLGDTWAWDGLTWRLAMLATSIAPRRAHAMAFHAPSGKILLMGGYRQVTQQGTFWFVGTNHPWAVTYNESFSETWAWDGVNWNLLGNTPLAARQGQSLIYDAYREKLVAYGGWSDRSVFAPGNPGSIGSNGWPGTVTSNPIIYDSALGNWGDAQWVGLDVSFPVKGAAMAFDSQRNELLHFGGQDGNGFLGSTWRWFGSPGTAAIYGTGCGTPPLTLQPSQEPTLHEAAQVVVSNAPTSFIFMLIGWSRTNINAFSLPIPLGGYGMPGCELLQSAESGSFGLPSTGPGTASYSLAIPNDPRLIGLNMHLQSWAVAPGQNTANTIASNGVSWRIGF